MAEDLILKNHGKPDDRYLYKWRHRFQNLCIECSEPIDNGTRRCKKHSEKNTLGIKRIIQQRKQSYRCTKCGGKLSNEIDGNHLTCIFCREMNYSKRKISERSQDAINYIQKEII